MLENIDKIIEFVTMLSTVLFVICRSNANVKKKIDEHLKPNGGSSVRDALDRIEKKLSAVEATQLALLDLQEESSGHFLANEKGSLFWVSDRFSEIVELDRPHCLGSGWLESIPDEQRISFYQNWSYQINTRDSIPINLTLRSGILIRFRAVPIVDPTDTLIGFVGNIKVVNS